MKYDTGKLKVMLLLAGLEGMNSNEIAAIAKVNKNTVSRITTGKTKQVTAETMNKFAEAFKCDVKELL